MGHRSARRIGMVAVTALALAGCNAELPVDAGPAPSRSAPLDPPAVGEASASSQSAGSSGSGPATDETTTIAVYLIEGELLERVSRTVPEVPGIGAEALRALLAGPTLAETRAGLETAIPTDTRLLGLTVSGGTATVDLSRAFESGGGTLGLTLRLAQVACTLDQFDSVDGVRFALGGELLSVFSGNGIVLDRPVNCASYHTYLPGGTPSGSPPATSGSSTTSPATPSSRTTPSTTTSSTTPSSTTLAPDSGDIGTFEPGDDGVHGGPAPGSDEDCVSTNPVGPC
jgi:hypothetical protein